MEMAKRAGSSSEPLQQQVRPSFYQDSDVVQLSIEQKQHEIYLTV